jgi:hypothetical protein
MNHCKEICIHCSGTGNLFGIKEDNLEVLKKCHACNGSGEDLRPEKQKKATNFASDEKTKLKNRILILEYELRSAYDEIHRLRQKVSNTSWDAENRRYEKEKERLNDWEHMGG